MIELARWQEHEAPTLARLWQLYVYDLSDLPHAPPIDAQARFPPVDAPEWIGARDADAWRILADGRLAGFALAAADGDGWFLHDFFVLRAERRAGVGRRAAEAVFARHPGPWALRVRDGNARAFAFWRAVAPAGSEQPPEVHADGIARVRFVFRSG